MGSLEWPFTHRNTTSPRLFTSVISGSHRSRLATGFLALFNQPRAIHPSHQRSRKQFTTYVESLTISRGPSMEATALAAAAETPIQETDPVEIVTWIRSDGPAVQLSLF